MFELHRKECYKIRKEHAVDAGQRRCIFASDRLGTCGKCFPTQAELTAHKAVCPVKLDRKKQNKENKKPSKKRKISF